MMIRPPHTLPTIIPIVFPVLSFFLGDEHSSTSGNKQARYICERCSFTDPDKAGLFQAILWKCPWPKLEKMIDLKAKFGEINDIEHNKGSKIYPQNQAVLDCIMPTISNHKY